MIVDRAVYADGRRRAGLDTAAELVAAAREPGAFLWMGLHEPTEAEFDEVRHELGLHPLAVEDAVESHQRPKLEVYDDTLFLVLKTARYDDAAEAVDFGELLVFVGAHFIVVVRHGEATALSGVRAQLEARPEVLAVGPAAVLHAVLDRVVDDYAPVMEGIDVDIDEVEADVFSGAPENPVQRIYELKREVLGVHRALHPLLEPLQRLASQPFPTIPESARSYFRDVHDHLLRVTEQNETHRDLLTSVLEANLTLVSVRQNEDMRRISAWVAMAAVPTLIAGIYGMNFSGLPGLRSTGALVAVLAVMGAVVVSLAAWFRRNGWL